MSDGALRYLHAGSFAATNGHADPLQLHMSYSVSHLQPAQHARRASQ